MPVPVASNPREVFSGVNPDAVLAVLLHKVVASAASAVKGAAEGHALLQDWLVSLAELYNIHELGSEGGSGHPVRLSPKPQSTTVKSWRDSHPPAEKSDSLLSL